MPVNKRKRETRGVRAMMMVAKLSLFFGRFAKMFDSRDRFVVYVVVVFLMKNCCVSSRGKSILTKKKRAFDADNFPQHPTILEKRLKWKNDDKALTFVLSAIDVTGFPRLSTRSCPCTIAFTSVLIVFLIVFAFCNMMMNESRDERQIVFFFQSSFNLLSIFFFEHHHHHHKKRVSSSSSFQN